MLCTSGLWSSEREACICSMARTLNQATCTCGYSRRKWTRLRLRLRTRTAAQIIFSLCAYCIQPKHCLVISLGLRLSLLLLQRPPTYVLVQRMRKGNGKFVTNTKSRKRVVNHSMRPVRRRRVWPSTVRRPACEADL